MSDRTHAGKAEEVRCPATWCRPCRSRSATARSCHVRSRGDGRGPLAGGPLAQADAVSQVPVPRQLRYAAPGAGHPRHVAAIFFLARDYLFLPSPTPDLLMVDEQVTLTSVQVSATTSVFWAGCESRCSGPTVKFGLWENACVHRLHATTVARCRNTIRISVRTRLVRPRFQPVSR